ncbi:UNVERIFIED_CONTAM: hypothetical protein GTU68_065584, partial [Idotea baltica]|nr:hypothetical protein [Idotea baltica]
AIWEPLLEPVERICPKDATTVHQPWKLDFEGSVTLGAAESDSTLRNPSPLLLSPSSDEFEMVEFDIPPPLTRFALKANDPLEFTVTKTFLEVLSVLSDSFVAAYKGNLSVRKLPKAPYKLINKTGLTISVGLKESGLKVTPSGENGIEQLLVEADGEVDLFESSFRPYTHRRQSSLVAQCQIASEKMISIKIVSVGAECLVPVTKADKRFFSITTLGKLKEKLGLVTSVSVEGGCKVITLSGCVKVTNELDTALDVYYMTEGGNEVEFVCALQPKEDTLLPLHAVYTPTSELFFSIKGYSVCINPLVWKKLQNYPNLEQELHCQPRNMQQNSIKMPFMFCANCEVEQIFWGNTSRRTLDSVMMDVSLRPCVILNNLLPVALSLFPPGD